MSTTMLDYTCNSIHSFHDALLKLTHELTPEQFYWCPGPQAPPIGWHLWHMARWADRVQAWPPAPDGASRRQIWDVEELALRYELDPAELGVVQCGEGMAHEAAAQLPRTIGQANIVAYAQRTFVALDKALDELTPQEIEWVRPNCRPYIVTADKRLVAAPANEEPLFSELAFHFRHTGRHLGIIEGLLGAQGLHGTASA